MEERTATKAKAKAAPATTPKRRPRAAKSEKTLAAGLDLLGRRWTLRIVWELRAGALTFRALQEACAVAPSVLNTRLSELKEEGIVEVAGGGYTLARRGRSLVEALGPVVRWAEASSTGRAR